MEPVGLTINMGHTGRLHQDGHLGVDEGPWGLFFWGPFKILLVASVSRKREDEREVGSLVSLTD